MDPNETIRRLRGLVSRSDDLDGTDVHELCELFIALDHWLTMGGFLPRDWRAEREA